MLTVQVDAVGNPPCSYNFFSIFGQLSNSQGQKQLINVVKDVQGACYS